MPKTRLSKKSGHGILSPWWKHTVPKCPLKTILIAITQMLITLEKTSGAGTPIKIRVCVAIYHKHVPPSPNNSWKSMFSLTGLNCLELVQTKLKQTPVDAWWENTSIPCVGISFAAVMVIIHHFRPFPTGLMNHAIYIASVQWLDATALTPKRWLLFTYLAMALQHQMVNNPTWNATPNPTIWLWIMKPIK